MHTRAPSAEKRSAASRPIPPAAPGMRATLPSSRRLAAERRLAVDERRHALAVAGRDERTHLGLRLFGVPDPHAAGGIGEVAEEAVVDRALDEDAGAGAAVLAGVPEHGGRGEGGG